MQYSVTQGDIDETKPLIYMWEIRSHSGEIVGRYVGKAKG